MKIIIAGCGKVGKNIAEELAKENHDLVLIDRTADIIQDLSNSLDCIGIPGDACSLTTLKDAGVESADLLLAVTSSDEVNMLCCLFARKLNSNIKTIARVRNPIYSIKEVNYVKEGLGLSSVINPELATAREILRVLRYPQAMKIELFARGRVELISFLVPNDNLLVNKKVNEISKIFDSHVLFVGIERNNEIIIPHGDTEILANDTVSVIAKSKDMNSLFSYIGLVQNPVKSVMICGGSTIAIYLSNELIKSGVKVKIIERDKNKCDQLAELLPNAEIILGDATDNNLLIEEGIETADGFISLTNVDEENVMLSLFAKNYSNLKVVTKTNHISFDSVINKLDIGSVVYPKHITSDYILYYVRGLSNAQSSSNIKSLYRILDNKAEALTFRIVKDNKLVGKKFKDLDIIDNLLICSIIRNDEVITPTGEDALEVGDTVLIVTSNLGIDNIEEIVK